jgi:hypothetical protein
MTIYEIRVRGHLDQRWLPWFEGLTMTYDGDDSTALRGPLVDEAALHGVLIKIRDLALPLLAVNRVEASGSKAETFLQAGSRGSRLLLKEGTVWKIISADGL